jgi:hypothetical protein
MKCQGPKAVQHLSAQGLTALSEPDEGQAECQAFQYLLEGWTVQLKAVHHVRCAAVAKQSAKTFLKVVHT